MASSLFIVDGPYNHHNGAMEVFAEEDGGCMAAWTSDLLPDAVAQRTSDSVDRGAQVMKRTLEGASSNSF